MICKYSSGQLTLGARRSKRVIVRKIPGGEHWYGASESLRIIAVDRLSI